MTNVNQQSSLLDAATMVCALVTQIREMHGMPQLAILRNQLLNSLDQFAQQASSAGFDKDAISKGHYALCAIIDESILRTPWGQKSGWASQGFAMQFYRENNAGEKFFLGLNKLAEQPDRHIALIELFYVCICLGFRGRFALIQHGENDLDRLRKQIYQLIEKQRGKPSPLLSENWQGSPTAIWKPSYFLPVWWAIITCIVIALLSLMIFRSSLNSLYSPEISKITKLMYIPTTKIQKETPKVTLTQLLKADIESGLVFVTEEPGHGIVRIRGDELFSSGSTHLNDSLLPVIVRVAQAVNTYGGMVTIAGHTDDRPIKALAIQSNLELSKLRARNVADIMAQYVSPTKMTVIGRGDMEPISPNNSNENRAKNRRVEVSVDSLK